MKLVASFASGVIFALGLGLAGMTDADTVLAFLNLAGTWDPTLAFVMVGAIGVHRLLYGWITRREEPILEDQFHLPVVQGIDRPLLGGAALFGLGWGLSGYCPGPAVVSVVSGSVEAVSFTGAMLVGVVLYWALTPKPAQGVNTDG
ncbi:MAG: YeeE/YedE family protein [Myxococcota bacterium]|nr:YeeE/YedE family protein [Myxococcota bacterium]